AVTAQHGPRGSDNDADARPAPCAERSRKRLVGWTLRLVVIATGDDASPGGEIELTEPTERDPRFIMSGCPYAEPGFWTLGYEQRASRIAGQSNGCAAH